MTVVTNEAGGVRVFAAMAAIGTTLLIIEAVRSLPPRAPLVRIVSVAMLTATILAMVAATVTAGRMQALSVAGVVVSGLATVLIRTGLEEALGTLLGVAAIGGGVAAIGGGVDALVGGDTLRGVAGLGLGVALIGLGVAVLVGGDTLLGVAAIGGGVAVTGADVALIVPSLRRWVRRLIRDPDDDRELRQ